MANPLEATLHPAWYHGHRTRAPYFEGWYLKLISAGQEHRYAVIPGIFEGAGSEASHAFVQVLDGVTGQATYHRYPVEDFWAAKRDLDVRVGPNHFTLERIHLQIGAPEQAVMWLQTNHFEQPRVSITGSVALIPWIGQTFRGFIVGVWHERVLYRFATYTGARIEDLAVGENDVEWTMRDRHHRLEIRARRTQASLLRGPSVADMGVRVPETLQATVQMRLSALTGRQERPIFEGTGHSAGLEVAGDIPRLLS